VVVDMMLVISEAYDSQMYVCAAAVDGAKRSKEKINDRVFITIAFLVPEERIELSMLILVKDDGPPGRGSGKW
jgi:hypothetical protein